LGEHILIGLAAIIVFGILAQWISWWLKLPSILLLLVFGFLAGPVTGFLNPDEFFGDLLFPFVSISVAIILFEGGLNLKFSELKPVFKIVRNLISIGTLVTWSLTTIAAHYLMELSFELSLLLGAILVVTGPTVIMPLLRLVKPKGQINSILKWEGIVNDPIGAMLAFLVFETIIASGVKEATLTAIFVILKTTLISLAIGAAGAYLLIYLLKKNFIPDYLQNPSALATIVLVFGASNTVQTESGLFAVTLMGIVLANQKQVVIEHIIEFKENLGVLLLSTLFIILAARLQISDIESFDMGSVLFVLALIFIIRPATIFSSTVGSHLTWQEKLYLSWMAPRGIVAAAVTAIFAIELDHNGYEGAEVLVPIMFLVIISTILVYGLSAIPLARILGLAEKDPQGILIAGVNKLSLGIAKTLEKYNIKVALVDRNWEKVTDARLKGVDTYFGSIVSESTIEDIDLGGIGKFISLTSNKGINSLAAIHFAKVFERSQVFQIFTDPKHNQVIAKELRSGYFSTQNLSFPDIEHYDETLQVKATKITEEFTYQEFMKVYNTELVHHLFILNKNNKLIVYSENDEFIPKSDEVLISLILDEKSPT